MPKIRRYDLSFFAILILLLGKPALAAQTAVGELAWANMTMGLFGGMGLLLYGMEQMTKALKAAARGKNIHTTITPQIIAFKVTKLALALIAVGFAVSFFSKLDTLRQYGGMFLGLGFLFFGLNVMDEAMTSLRNYQTVSRPEARYGKIHARDTDRLCI